MSTVLIPELLDAETPRVGYATLKILVSPVRGRDGKWRVLEEAVSPGTTPVACLPTDIQWLRVIHNGKVLALSDLETVLLAPGDELLAIPAWGVIGGTLASLLIYAVVSIAISVAATALTYLLFPPDKP